MAANQKKKTPFKVAQGRRLRRALDASGKTQSQLSELVDVRQSHISAALRGESLIAPEKIMKIAAALGVPLSDLTPTPDELGDTPSKNLEPSDTVEPSGPAKSGRGQPEVEGFLARHGTKQRVTRREAWYLRHNSHFRLESWVVQDDHFWQQQLEFWRKYLREQDEAAGEGMGGPDTL